MHEGRGLFPKQRLPLSSSWIRAMLPSLPAMGSGHHRGPAVFKADVLRADDHKARLRWQGERSPIACQPCRLTPSRLKLVGVLVAGDDGEWSVLVSIWEGIGRAVMECITILVGDLLDCEEPMVDWRGEGIGSVFVHRLEGAEQGEEGVSIHSKSFCSIFVTNTELS